MALHPHRFVLTFAIFATIFVAACTREGGHEANAPAQAESTPAESTAAEPEAAPQSELAGTAWKLVKIQSMDDTVALPAEDTAYTITFNADGSAVMQIDCNRGNANWDSPGPKQLTFGPVAATRAMCPPGSIDVQFIKELGFVRSYVLEGGHLHLATMADGSIIEFEPLEE